MNKCIASASLRACEARGPTDTSVLEDKCFGLKCLIIEVSDFSLRAVLGISMQKIRSAVLPSLKWRTKVSQVIFAPLAQWRVDGSVGDN